jgi:hypothetical protein
MPDLRVLAEVALPDVDLSTATFGTYAELGRVPAETGVGGRVAKEVLVYLTVTGAGGGTQVKVRCIPAWNEGDAGVQATPMQIAEADDAATLSEIVITGSTSHVLVAQMGTEAVLADFPLPPYVVVEVEENRTSGTLTVDLVLRG